MSDTPAPTYTIAANLRWFALIYFVIFIAVLLAISYLHSIGVTLPTTGLGVGLYAGVVAAAAYRFAGRRDWTSRDRNLLALGYMIIAATISLVLSAALIVIDPDAFPSSQGLGGPVGMAAIVVIAVALIYFAVARLVLMLIARFGRRNHTTN